jgi:hypothetical protein
VVQQWALWRAAGATAEPAAAPAFRVSAACGSRALSFDIKQDNPRWQQLTEENALTLEADTINKVTAGQGDELQDTREEVQQWVREAAFVETKDHDPLQVGAMPHSSPDSEPKRRTSVQSTRDQPMQGQPQPTAEQQDG